MAVNESDNSHAETAENEALESFSSEEPGSLDCERVLRDWFPRLKERASNRAGEALDQFTALLSGNTVLDWATAYRDEIVRARYLLENVRTAFWSNASLKEGKYLGSGLWAWPTDQALHNPPPGWLGRSPTDLDILDLALAEYIKRPDLQHNAIDISAINAVLFTALTEHFEAVRAGTIFGQPNWSYVFSGGNVLAQALLAAVFPLISFLLSWVMLPAIGVWALVNGHDKTAFVALGMFGLSVLYRLITIPNWWRRRTAARNARSKAEKILIAMTQAWNAARTRTINPTRLKEFVLAAEESGAVFRPVVHTLLDRAIQRDPTALVR
jgi:hypothetical protein